MIVIEIYVVAIVNAVGTITGVGMVVLIRMFG